MASANSASSSYSRRPLLRRVAARARRAARRATRSDRARRVRLPGEVPRTRPGRHARSGTTVPSGARKGVTGSTDTLQERRDAPRRSDLAHEIDVADVDAELQRRSGHEGLEGAGFETCFGVQPLLFRETAMMRRDRVLPDALAQLPRQALGHPSRVDEHECGPVCGDQFGEPVVILGPDLVRHDRLERRTWHLQSESHRAAVAFVDDRARGVTVLLTAPSRRGTEPPPRSAFALPRVRGAGAVPLTTSCSRSRVSARCAPRRVPMTA